MKYIVGIWCALLLGSIVAFTAVHEGSGLLRVVFLDVGQGDSIYIEAPNGTQVLIDGGRGSQVLSGLGEVMPMFDRSIDIVIATHPDSDHIGGLPEVFELYEISLVLEPGITSDTKVYDAFESSIAEKEIDRRIPKAGEYIDLGDGVVLKILFPDTDVSHEDSNNGSISVQLVYGDSEFLLTGDAPQGIEKYLVYMYGEKLQSDVLKAGHHGSKTSTAQAFLETVLPEYVVISAGEDNRYGHPHEEVIERIKNFGSSIVSTYKVGNIEFISDGSSIEYRR